MTHDTRTRDTIPATAARAQSLGSAAFGCMVRWSRSIGMGSRGKAEDELKTRVSFDEGADFRRLANELDLSTSELLRQLVRIRLYGVERVAMMERNRLEVVAGRGTEEALDR